MFSNGKIDFECIVPSYLQSRAEALFLIWWFDHFLFTFFLAHPTRGRHLVPAVTVDSQSVYFGFCLFFSCRIPIKGNSSLLWSDSKLEQTWTWLPLTLDSVWKVTTLPTGLSILVFVSSSVASFDCYCFCIPSSPSFCFVGFEQIFGFKFSKTKTFCSRILSEFCFVCGA